MGAALAVCTSPQALSSWKHQLPSYGTLNALEALPLTDVKCAAEKAPRIYGGLLNLRVGLCFVGVFDSRTKGSNPGGWADLSATGTALKKKGINHS